MNSKWYGCIADGETMAKAILVCVECRSISSSSVQGCYSCHANQRTSCCPQHTDHGVGDKPQHHAVKPKPQPWGHDGRVQGMVFSRLLCSQSSLGLWAYVPTMGTQIQTNNSFFWVCGGSDSRKLTRQLFREVWVGTTGGQRLKSKKSFPP